MIAFVIARIVRLAFVLAAITVASFAFMQAIPGDPIVIRLGEHATPAEMEALRRSLGLDQPWFVQLGVYVAHVLHGDLGRSVNDAQPVSQKLLQYFPATVELSLGALLFAVIVGVPAGIAAALRRHSVWDVLTMSGVLLGVSIPVFWLG